jgi:nucleoside-diphosphate-sugar epimerase
VTHAIITGAGGFIGRAVVEQLTKAGTNVTQWTRPLDSLARHGGSADVVFHLASSPRHAESAASARPDVAGTEAVLEYCRSQGAACVLASTAGVYRSDAAAQQNEDAPISPANAYAAAKLAAEECCRDAATRFGTPSAMLRLFNVYGPGQRPPFLVPAVVDAVATGKPIELKMPDAVRDFVFVDDVARAFVAAVDWSGSGARAINIGSGSGTRVRDLFAMVAELLGKSPDWTPTEERSTEVQSSVADIERAHAELGWRPAVGLEAGLRATCESPHQRGTAGAT